MSLRELAEMDLAALMEDEANGFGWAITVTDPRGKVGRIVGLSNDIAQLIDPDTGQAVSGRLASAAIRISSLKKAGLGLPVGISSSDMKPWLVQFDDIGGTSFIFKVAQSNPDRGLGVVSLILETYT